MGGLKGSDSLELGGKLYTICAGVLKRGYGLVGVSQTPEGGVAWWTLGLLR